MAGIGSSGGLDVKSIVDNLMIGESKKLTTMQKKVEKENVQLSGYGQLSSLVNTLKSNIDNLKTAINTGYVATVSDDTKITASITNSEQVFNATHNVVVSKLATAETWSSVTPTSARSTALGLSGNLTMTIGSSNFTITIDTDDTLDNIRDKINNTSSNIGVTASVLASNDISGNPQFNLMVASDNTGVANKVTLSGTGVAALTLTNETVAAQNAEFTVDSKSVIRSSNTVTDVVDGISFNLLTTGSSSFTVALDQDAQNSSVISSLHSVVDAYNQMIDFVDRVSAERTMTDSTVANTKYTIRNIFHDSISGITGITSLFDLGVTYGPSVVLQTNKGKSYTSAGRLKVVDADVTSALNENRTNIKKFISDTSTGFVKTAADTIKTITGYTGTIELRKRTIDNMTSRLDKSISLEEERLDQVRLILTKKYANLNSIMDKFDQISTFLDGQFASVNSTKSK
ncbi:MAG TPA: flagellar filament capping protein FliD [Gammaproteobacteria bacterium]|nr:flagellar filament capping protein FliD [Gammaproteobacteria bacterium]